MRTLGRDVPHRHKGAPGSPAIEIHYDLDAPMADELFDYLTSSEE